MGIGGVGMAGLAFLFHRDGCRVTGCDKYSSSRTAWLAQSGIAVSTGHDPAHLSGVDELIVTPAVPTDAPEWTAARAAGIPVRYRGDVLAERVNASFGIAICGTHGKTTTATFTTKLLKALGADPSWCIGGETGSMPVAGVTSRHDASAPFVVEADESDGTLARYQARILVVMNMDYDHPEHFPDEAAYRACYATAMAQAETVIRAETLDVSEFPEIAACVTGAHNRINARAAIEVALKLGYARADIVAALPRAVDALPDRRFQRIYPVTGQAPSADCPCVYTDYAHHPRELACAVEMARAVAPRRLRVLFQPHRHSRTARLCADFPAAFAAADEVILLPVYAAFEQPIPGGDIADLYKAFRDQGFTQVKLARSAREAWHHVFLTTEPDDLVLLAGAGDIIKLVPVIQRDLAGSPAERAARRAALRVRRWIGQGSNTWKSDLVTGEEYVRTQGPADRPGATLGIPWMAGIPGTIGGWVKMNAGAFGHAIGELVCRVKVDGVWRAAADCGFAYRRSSIAGEIQDVEFDLPESWPETAADYRTRRRHFPAGTHGSVFKNPAPDQPAGRILEAAGAKDLRVGGAFVWSEHANVIVAGPDATPSDELALARLMARAAFFASGVKLEPEVQGLEVD